MKYQWVGKNVNLSLLTEGVENFLINWGFKVQRIESGNDCYKEVLGVFGAQKEDLKRVKVILEKNTEGFSIEFAADEKKNFLLKLGFLTSFFGGGPLLRKAYKNNEFYQKLEDAFWKFLELEICRYQ